MTTNIIRPVILCGGTGTRLWPLSREIFPKQFVNLIQGQTLMDLTLDRVNSLGDPICITNEDYKYFVQEALSIFLSGDSTKSPLILLEPMGRNTAAAMASAVCLPSVGDSDLLLFLPADHYMPNIETFLSTIHSGVAAAQENFIVTFGVLPSFPSSEYGYIQQGSALNCTNNEKFRTYEAKRFIEKPSATIAKEMISSGGYYWNTGIFLCRASVLKDAFSRYAGDILANCKKAMELAHIEEDFIRPDYDTFLSCRSESFDCAVMERFDKVAMIPYENVWSDLGSWGALASLSSADESGNRINGHGHELASRNTYIYAPHRPVVALGTSDLIIVDTPDAVLVASTSQVDRVKEMVLQLKHKGVSQAINHRRVPRPWGWYDLIDTGQRFKVKRILVKPGAALSLQLHHHRAEHWIVVKGMAKITNGDDTFFLQENQSTYIPIGFKHRLENPGTEDLEMIEVQSGDYLSEDDIVRFEDTYGRK